MLKFVQKYAGAGLVRRARALAKEFLRQTEHAPDIQRRLLLDYIARNSDSQFGRDHHFAEIKTAADFRRHVPIRGYEGHEPYIERVRNGDLKALFGGPTEVLMFARTSGTTARPKTIPVTRESLNQYRDGWKIWGILAFDAHPEIIKDGLMPILQLASDWRESTTPSGLPCGAITGLTAQMQNPLLRLNYCMPPAGSRVKDVEAKYYLALRMSVYRDVGAIIAANPSTLLGLARLGDREKETLIKDLYDGSIDPKWDIAPDIRDAVRIRSRWKRRKTSRRLEAVVHEHGRLLPSALWPKMQFLANWTGGTMGAFLADFPEYFGDVPVRDPGLIASEGRMTIPIEDGSSAGLLDFRHHYFEFLREGDEDNPEAETLEAVDLQEGERYFLLMTTSAGLYRYHIHDLVRCVGFHGRTPLVEFLNKGAHFSSMTGEKLSEFQVVAAVEAAKKIVGARLRSFLLLPDWGHPPRYVFFVEEPDIRATGLADRLEAELDRQLGLTNEEYENRRSTHRLGHVRLEAIPAGSWDQFRRDRLSQSGGAFEQYKQPCLLSDLKLIERFRTRSFSRSPHS
jgi:GH3 auxin-responsive promoter